ncbi:DEAD/DEAH box helicase family protein [Methanoculleus sp. YWC-01]|uniref:DEAD/DEAH box helicase family protein n=1 Tax=Methanoculleus nereidis TaxID=2735141 RepID=A0ABU3Z587_9EURY|nr:DEAD/DEAH box helicase [Methanoculleus sp. YWC-01]MDV4343779.1 DEAD/DEAH box helicase family protein [Methanoculleus sp. YWC-01]
MFTIDYDPNSDRIAIRGISATQLLKSRSGTALSVILGFRPQGNDLLIGPAENRPGSKIADTVKTLSEAGIDTELSDTAKRVLKEHITYLRSFRSSSVAGRELFQNPPVSVSLPPSFHRELRKFQILPVRHLIEVANAANFSVPGSGKTTMVLAAYSILKDIGEISKIFVVCPRSAFVPWTEEYQECFGATPNALQIAGQPLDRAQQMANAERFELFLCTYQMLANERDAVAQILRKYPCLLVLDESHHIKRGEGGAWFDAVNEIAPLARRRIILTGTPAPNRLEDLLPQFEVLWPGLNPARKAMDLYGKDDRIEDFRESLRPYYARVRKDELELPKRNVIRIPVRLGDVQQRIYNILCNRILPHTLRKIEERNLVRDLRKALVIRLLQAASNPTLLGEYSNEFRVPPFSAAGVDLDQLIQNYSDYETPQKLLVAVNIATQLAEERQKSIIWTSFVHNAELLYKTVKDSGIEAVLVTGSTTKDEGSEQNRDALLHQFKTDKSTKVLVATIPAIAESVSLHKECHDAIYVDRTFNCGLYMQTLDRIHRVGLPPDANVRYHLLLGVNTLDETVNTRLQHKMDVMYRVLNDDIDILDLDVPDDLSEGDWDSDDIAAVLEHLRQHISQ